MGMIGKALLVALLLLAVLAPQAGAVSGSPCLAVDNLRGHRITIQVQGWPGYWTQDADFPGSFEWIVYQGHDIRASSFTIRAADGGADVSSRINWQYYADETDKEQCPDGTWDAVVY